MRSLGACYLGGNTCEFSVWAPLRNELSLVLADGRTIPLQCDENGFFHVLVDNVPPGTKYFYQLDKERRPDPASFYQPEDVMGPSVVIDHEAYIWQDKDWKGIELKDMIIYELHLGTFTSQGTFEAAIERLDDLCELGITAIEIMPVAQFPGSRNWGYDGVYPFAVQNTYGGPDGFKKFVDVAHRKGLAVILDVVYNHLGPEGNFLAEYMPCFTNKYSSPWGQSINFDDPYSSGIRAYFVQNALYWTRHFHVDGLRLDAIHGIYDMSARHFLKELAEAVNDFSHQFKRKVYLIAESDLNDRRIVISRDKEGYGLHAQWSDDFHHIVHTLLTHETNGYYQDFNKLEQLAKVLKEGFIFTGEYSNFRKRRHGDLATDIPAERFVVCTQNHDQVGNRLKGERLSSLVSFEALKLAAGILLLSPYVPLLFMGEEYGEDAPFLYFMSFYDQDLVQRVREGRKREFLEFQWNEEPTDPYAQETFERCKLNWQRRLEGRSGILLSFYKQLIHLRKTMPALNHLDKESLQARIKNDALIVQRQFNGQTVYMAMNFQNKEIKVGFDYFNTSTALKILDSGEEMWGGSGKSLPKQIVPKEEFVLKPTSFVVYEGVL